MHSDVCDANRHPSTPPPHPQPPAPGPARRPAAELLEHIARGIEERIGRQRFEVWFIKGVRLRIGRHEDSEALDVVIVDDFVLQWVRRHFDAAIREAAEAEGVVGSLVRYELSRGPFGSDERNGLFAMTCSGGGGSSVEATPDAPASRQIVLPPAPPAVATRRMASDPEGFFVGGIATRADQLRYDLDTFVPADNNRLAYECCRSVADNLNSGYNPLFVHGKVGLGKTHLLQALCRHYARQHATGRWMYMTGEDFTISFIAAIRNNRVDGFRRRLRDVDLLVIDDVHFLGGKRATQEEFLHTFNAIEAAGRHVVIASDAHPKTIAAFGESLTSRFVSGMVARVDAPTRGMRENLLRTLATRVGLSLDDETVAWTAQRVTRNVRELEGVVNRLHAHARLEGRRVDLAFARNVLSDFDMHLDRPIRADQVLDATCEFFGILRSELLGGGRQRTIGLARSTSMFLVRKLTTLSYPDIAGRLGKRNHSTVISACRRVEASIRRNDTVTWQTATGERTAHAAELIQRLEELARTGVGDDA